MLLVAGGARGTGAAPRRAAETPERRLASLEFKRGKALYASGDYEGALAAFESGFAAYPLRGFLINIGQCHRRLGHLKEAAARYQQFLDGPDVSPTLRAEVEEALAEVRSAQRAAGEATETPQVERAPEPAPVVQSETPSGARLDSDATLTKAQPEKKKVKPWVWAVVGVSAAVVVAGVGLGVGLGLRAQNPSGGSLGILDARSP